MNYSTSLCFEDVVDVVEVIEAFCSNDFIDVVKVVELIDACKSACKFMSLNVQCLMVHASDILSERVILMADVLVFTETCEKNDATTELAGFICISKAMRQNARVGGVSLYQSTTATTIAVPHAVKHLSAHHDIELGLSDEYGDVCAAEIVVNNTLVLLIGLFISPGMQS